MADSLSSVLTIERGYDMNIERWPPVPPRSEPESVEKPEVQTAVSPLTWIGLFWAFVIEGTVVLILILIWRYCF